MRSKTSASCSYQPWLHRVLLVGFVSLIATVPSGCKAWHKRATWNGSDCKIGLTIQADEAVHLNSTPARRRIAEAARCRQLAQHASVLEAAKDPSCVDHYFAAVCAGWEMIVAQGNDPAADELLERASIYHASLAKLMQTAQQFGRFDPRHGLHVTSNGQPLTIPASLYGFSWSTADFNELQLVGDYQLGKQLSTIRSPGIGVPLVVIRRRPTQERFFRKDQAFAATVVLRVRDEVVASPNEIAPDDPLSGSVVLEFYNTAHATRLHESYLRWPLASDLTAPLAWQLSQNANNPIGEFIHPDAEEGAQLVMLEPYQPGKIPIVFVHGLLSDPTTWVSMWNELRTKPWFREQYQAWAFRYPSGTPFLVSAAKLRRELNAALAYWPDAADDPAAAQMVLIGHSMGGLVSKLQVTESGTELWDLVANRPLDQINASQADRGQLREVFFFRPLPFVKRVVFIGTPHRGASLASRGIGRVTSALAHQSTEADERHRRLVADNPGVFVNWMQRRIPSSVDLLKPDNPLLSTMEKLPVAPDVKLGSIIGVSKLNTPNKPGDGVVLLASAQLPHVASEKLVSESHEQLHRAATTLIEIERLLQEHLQDTGATLFTP